MMRSLYVRIVVTFLFAVVIGLFVAFTFTTKLYESDITSNVQNKMVKAAKETIQLCQTTSPDKLDMYLISLTKLNAFQIRLYDETGVFKKFGAFDEIGLKKLTPVIVSQVLNNQPYYSDTRDIKEPDELVVGLPFELEGKKYALFLQPRLEKQFLEFQKYIWTVLLIMLSTGAVIFFFATRYIVRPIKEMTLATKRMAKGDFDVELKVKRKDELGILADSFQHMSAELKQLEEMRQNFVSNVSHEIQSPLTSILGFTKALQNQQITEEERMHYLGIIEKESERLSRLSKNLLQLASLESDHHPFHKKKYRLDEQIRRVAVALEPQWSKKELTLFLNLPRLDIVADEDKINQVFTNLLANSIKFTPGQGEIRIEAWESENSIFVKISDTGIGISKEDQDKIFQRFYKTDKSRNRSIDGSGLGLSIVKKIVELHKGTIAVESEVGKGTSFILCFPTEG